MLAWHFVGKTLRDGNPIPPDGETLVHEGPVVICVSGFHASERISDALSYAPGDTICRVKCEDIVDQEDDKLVCRLRTILWRIDGGDVLRAFARKCALDVGHLWDMPSIVSEYLETGRESIMYDAEDAISAAGPIKRVDYSRAQLRSALAARNAASNAVQGAAPASAIARYAAAATINAAIEGAASYREEVTAMAPQNKILEDMAISYHESR